LLFGVIALQAELINADQFAEACSTWSLRAGSSLPEILREKGRLHAEDQAPIEYLVERRLIKFGGDVRNSLAGCSAEIRSVLVAAILGLLAFILAFTFSMAATRYDARRQVVLEEANAVGTTYLRARLLPEPQRTEVARLLREYIDVRVRGVQEGKVAEAIARSEELQEALWSEAVRAADNKLANPIMTGIFVQSLNEMIDLHAKRVTVGTRNRVPFVIWIVLFAFIFLGLTAVGYQSGLSGTRRSPAMPGIVLAFAVVLYLIADLDRGSEGFISVSQQALLDLQRSMQATKS
jgi:hypothetical protein